MEVTSSPETCLKDNQEFAKATEDVGAHIFGSPDVGSSWINSLYSTGTLAKIYNKTVIFDFNSCIVRVKPLINLEELVQSNPAFDFKLINKIVTFG